MKTRANMESDLQVDNRARLIDSAKRVGIAWVPGLGDLFVSYNSKTDSGACSGPWEHWVDLAIQILQSPLTQITYPRAYQAADGLSSGHLYDSADRYLTKEEILTHAFSGGTDMSGLKVPASQILRCVPGDTGMAMTLREFADKVDWEGGLWSALEYGLTPEDAPEGEFRELWRRLHEGWEALQPLAESVEDYWDKHMRTG